MKNSEIQTLLITIADRQTEVFSAYQQAGVYRAAQADPTSAIAAIAAEMYAYHWDFTVMLQANLDMPMARDYAEHYIELMNELLPHAERELTDRDWSKT